MSEQGTNIRGGDPVLLGFGSASRGGGDFGKLSGSQSALCKVCEPIHSMKPRERGFHDCSTFSSDASTVANHPSTVPDGESVGFATASDDVECVVWCPVSL